MSAERGWLIEPQPERERTPPSHADKWYKMMGAVEQLPARRKMHCANCGGALPGECECLS